ncbi:MAG: ABC transporter ATP-binding protein/permease [Actinomycetota bacterium]|nr:ABC transporter ATP-binding protein/permease [Actinomycetota bacterium]
MAGAKRTEAKLAGAEPATAALRMARAMRGVPGAASAWLRGRPAAVRDSTRLRAVRLLWSLGPGWALAVLALILVEALAPNAALVAMARVVGVIPAAARAGLHGAAGTRLILALVLSAGLYALSLLSGPYERMLSTSVKARLTEQMQQRLMHAVCAPIGISHLEDAPTLERLELAQGTLAAWVPADAPVTLASVIGTRLGGVLACVVVGTFRWWLGLGLLLMWLAVRRPLRRIIVGQVIAYRMQAEAMRRANAFHRTAWRPESSKEMRVFGLGAWMVDGYRRHAREGIETSWRALRKVNPTMAVLGAVVLAGCASTLFVVAHAALRHEVSLQTFYVVVLMLFGTMNAGSITYQDITLEWMLSGLPDVDQLEHDLAGAGRTLPGGRAPESRPEREVRFRAVHFAYPESEHEVLRGLDLVIPAARSTAIVGLNGAGKTTLVKLLTRLHDPTAGDILADGIPLSELDAGAWQRQVAVVFQDFNRYPVSARENVAFGAPAHAVDQQGIERACARAGADGIVAALPASWETTLSRDYEGGSDLSGGQWQRVALARALFAVAHGARILILDEPTAWLDVRAEAQFFDSFLEIAQGTTTILISHRFSTVRRAEHICLLAGGVLAQEGSHEQLLAQGGPYRNMFHLQAERFTAPAQTT